MNDRIPNPEYKLLRRLVLAGDRGIVMARVISPLRNRLQKRGLITQRLKLKGKTDYEWIVSATADGKRYYENDQRTLA